MSLRVLGFGALREIQCLGSLEGLRVLGFSEFRGF